MSVEAREHRFTVDDFHRMAETDLLSPSDRLELIDGVVVETTPAHPPHASTVKRFAKALFSLFGDRTTIGVQDSIVLHDPPNPFPTSPSRGTATTSTARRSGIVSDR